jgi:hypothetical protein
MLSLRENEAPGATTGTLYNKKLQIALELFVFVFPSKAINGLEQSSPLSHGEGL